VNVEAVGTLAMHGVTRPVTVTMQARDSGRTIQISGQIPVVFANWNISNPSFGSFVKTQDHGLVEFLLNTKRS
jgi:polyisoprenoid-binding protein YceI